MQCRRAGAAAFQEIVGRLGNFSHGIEIITKADYFTLSNRSDSYTKVSVFVGKFEEYRFSYSRLSLMIIRYHLIAHLLEFKLKHWDRDIRILSAQGLQNFTHLEPNYFVEQVIPKLLTWYVLGSGPYLLS